MHREEEREKYAPKERVKEDLPGVECGGVGGAGDLGKPIESLALPATIAVKWGWRILGLEFSGLQCHRK